MSSFAVTCPDCNTRSRKHQTQMGRRVASDDGVLRWHKCVNCASHWYTFQADPVTISKYQVQWPKRALPPAVVPLGCGTVAAG
jgi:hypothetical protein